MNDSIQTASSDCGCGTGQTASSIACPVCRRLGVTVRAITPGHTLKKTARGRFDPERPWHFCENPDCSVAYYNEDDRSVFTLGDLKNRVTIKDDSPETPLCYCFKVLKKQALAEIAATGSTNVFRSIQAKMKPGQSCFCEKANPRGDTCARDIREWMLAQGIDPDGQDLKDNPVAEEQSSGCGCSC